jgi:hypothetical protein
VPIRQQDRWLSDLSLHLRCAFNSTSRVRGLTASLIGLSILELFIRLLGSDQLTKPELVKVTYH